MDLSNLHNLMDDFSRKSVEENVLTDAQEEELRTALETHPEWMESLRSRELLDSQLCKVMTDIEIPTGLKDRLIAEIDFSSDSSPNPIQLSHSLETDTQQSRQQRSRRRAFGLLSAASLLFAASVWSIFSSLSPDLTVAQIQDRLPALWDFSVGELSGGTSSEVGLKNLVNQESVVAELPSGGWNTSRLNFSDDWNHVELTGPSGCVVSYRRFSFRTGRGMRHEGLLVSLPASSFSHEERPSSTDPFSADIRYLSTKSGTSLAIVSWNDPQTDSVYFLTIPAGNRTLDALESLFYVRPV